MACLIGDVCVGGVGILMCVGVWGLLVLLLLIGLGRVTKMEER